LKKTIVNKIREILQIEREIDDQKILNFVEKQELFPIIYTLAKHYWEKYPKGLELLGKIVSLITKDEYFKARYNLKDYITRTQLLPLLEAAKKKEKAKEEEIINKWRGYYFTFKVIVERKEKPEIPEVERSQIFNYIKQQMYNHKHYERIFDLEELKNIQEKTKQMFVQFLSVIFEKKKEKLELGKLTMQLKEEGLDENRIKILTGFIQILEDLFLKQKPYKEILSSVARLNNKYIIQLWPSFGELTVWKEDIYGYLNQTLKGEIKKIIQPITTYLSYFTDHPKTLLEIGKYPVSTCQNYESTDIFNCALLGYVFDAHIKALVLREVNLENSLSEEELNQCKIEIDEYKEIIFVKTPQGEVIKGILSKPLARRIVMLGSKMGKPILLLEPIYSKWGRKDEFIEGLLNAPLEKIKKELSLESTKSGKGISLPGSHNPAGYYRDV
jgi:hypothetical protein